MTGITFTRGESRRMSSMSISRRLPVSLVCLRHTENLSLRVTSRVDKVKQGVHPVVPEPWISLDPRLFSQDIIILPLEVG